MYAMEAGFSVKTDVFEGPLELLLRLIEKRKLLINDVSLVQVTDDYLKHVEKLESFPVAESANFVVVASTLLLIKSRSLLPGLELTKEEQADIEELEERLREYKRMTELSRHISTLFGRNMIFEREESKGLEPVFVPDKSFNLENLLSAVKSVIGQFPVKKVIPKAMVKKVIGLEEAIESLSKRIQASIKISFKEFSKGTSASGTKTEKEKKVNVIMGFLAMLELIKQGIIGVRQEEAFSDIEMESREVGTPTYE